MPDLDTITDAMTTHTCLAPVRSLESKILYVVPSLYFCIPTDFQNTWHWPAKQYYNSRTVELPHPTNSTAELLQYAQASLNAIFQFGYNFQKVGIILTNLVPADYRQKGLFVEGPDERMIKLAALMDKLNYRYGRDKLRLASQMYNPDWPMKQEYLSKRYTTDWKEILTAQ